MGELSLGELYCNHFSQYKILATENRVRQRKLIAAAHTKFIESAINRSVDRPTCYYILRKQLNALQSSRHFVKLEIKQLS